MLRGREQTIGIAVGLAVLAGLSGAVGLTNQLLWPRLAEVSFAPVLFILLPLIAMAAAIGVAVLVSEFLFTRWRLRPELESAAAPKLRIMNQTDGLEDAVCALGDMFSDDYRKLAQLAEEARDLPGSLWQCDWAARTLARGRPVLEPIFGERRRALNLKVSAVKAHAEAIQGALTGGSEREFATTVAEAFHAMTFPSRSASAATDRAEQQKQRRLFLEVLKALGSNRDDFGKFCEVATVCVRDFATGGRMLCYWWGENADLYLVAFMLSSYPRTLHDPASEMSSLLTLRTRVDWEMLRRRLERRDLAGAMRISLVP